MKNLKKMLSLAVTLAVVFCALNVPVKANAAESKTWYVTYDAANARWAASADNKKTWSSADLASFAAGDSIVIDADGVVVEQITSFTVYQNVKEIAFTGKALAAVTAPYVEHVYSVNGSTGVVNGNVGSVDAYAGAVVQVNGNVNTFTAHYENGIPKFAVTGTVGTAYVKWNKNWLGTDVPAYNVVAGKFISDEDGAVRLEAGQYTETAPAAPQAPATEQKAPESGKVLDSVPKTGFVGLSETLIFLLIAAVFAGGALAYKKRA